MEFGGQIQADERRGCCIRVGHQVESLNPMSDTESTSISEIRCWTRDQGRLHLMRDADAASTSRIQILILAQASVADPADPDPGGRSLMESLLGTYVGRRRCAQPGSFIDPPMALVTQLSANALQLADTLTQGDCGVHAFAISLQDRADAGGLQLTRSHAFKTFRAKMKQGLSALMNHLRQTAVAWMQKHGADEVWAGVTFAALASSMSQDPTQSFAAHMQRIQNEGEWIDASVLHALGCVFHVDVAIWFLLNVN